MKIAIGTDHRGFELKLKVIDFLKELGHEVIDYGTDSTKRVDYPKYAFLVGESINKTADRGILLCGSGNGIAIAVNKVKGVRCALCYNAEIAYMSRLDNDSNVLAIPADYLTEEEVKNIIRVWLDTEFLGGRHQRRIDMITAYENKR
ncbi:MAG TPA: ribose 5-phosphate isomerase B [Tenericutes bacterium]|nr:ribose 5-phosphate isomerase B [Mycoplasmatota bacterium]